ncbi:MAG TPA: phage holin family protein [Candidatus Dormibacteraeota bacterium]|nr:phage holin family protein [Candidatus Dormibacteraeota bacterium]
MAATQTQHDQESLGDIGRQIADDAARLVRTEIELAKTGMIESLKRGAVAIGLIVVALPLILIGMTLAFAALPKHFGDVWWSYALTGAGFLLAALLLGGLAGLRIRAMVRTQKETIAAIKEDVEWVKQLTRRDKSAT